MTPQISVPQFKAMQTFRKLNVAANLTNVALAHESIGDARIVMTHSGQVIGCSVWSKEARTAGSLTVHPTVNDQVLTQFQATLNEVSPQGNHTRSHQTFFHFLSGDRLGMVVSTTADWTPTTADIIGGICITQLVE